MMFEALLWLFIKHFICDFPLQSHPWIYRNKGIYGHLSGVVHAATHGVGTYMVLRIFNIEAAAMLAFADCLVHYHIDWAKVNINLHFKLKPDASPWFWFTLGLDQLLHHLTYFAIIGWAFSHAS